MPLYRAHYTLHGREHTLTFVAIDPQAADAYAQRVVAGIVGAPIADVEEFSPRPYRRQRTLWEKPE